MNILLKITDKLREIYADYDIVIRPVIKFGLAVMTLLLINNELGYLSALNNLFILIVLAVICAILPLNGTVLIGTLLIVAHCLGLGTEVGAFAVILYLLMLLLYFRFVPKDALVILLTPAAFLCRIPAVIPLSLGQIRNPVSAFSVAFGIVSWQFIQSVHDTIDPMKSMADVSMLDMIQAMPKALLTQDMIFRIIIFVVVLLVVIAVRHLGGSYAYEKAIIAGTIVYVVLEVAGGQILGVEADIMQIIPGAVISLLIAWFLKLFYYSPDYKASEHLQFEDDRNYYHVKVIPKLHPIDSRTGDELEKENDAEVPEINTKRFRQLQEEEIEQRFKNVDLQSELEHSLKSLGAKTSLLPGNELQQQAPEEPKG